MFPWMGDIGKKDGLFKIKISTEPETHIAHEIGS